VEGFSDLISELSSGAVSVVFPAFMWGAPSWGALGDFGHRPAIVSSSIIYCTCCIPPSSFLIYTYIFQTSFPRGGFIQGHVDQKHLCTKMHVLVSWICLFSVVNIFRCVVFILDCMY
jgi:hypothetical protein